MLKNITSRMSVVAKIPRAVTNYCMRKSEMRASPILQQYIPIFNQTTFRPLTVYSCLLRDKDKRINADLGFDDGTQGSLTVPIDRPNPLAGIFPDENTPDLLFDGVRFADLHIMNVTVTKNNTKISVANSSGRVLMNRSCSIEGFKNAKKKTSIAAQATGISLGLRMLSSGIKNVRAKINGLGPGRIAGLKGITMAGVNVVSISDITDINYTNQPRPKKRRRV